MTIRFTIHGNQEDPHGNAIPKVKMTARQQWTPKAQRYAAWKSFVSWRYFTALDPTTEQVGAAGRSIALGGKPIPGSPEATMKLKITWANEKHADAESVFGSIADALFENDKHVAGAFSFTHAADKKGKVDVEITI